MNSIVRTIEKISDWIAKVSAVILGLMTILILVEIALWNFFEKTTLIADEYSAYGLAIIIFLGSGYCLKEKGHIRLTLLYALFPGKASQALTFISSGITTGFMAYMWWYLFLMVRSTIHYGSTSGTLSNTPLWIPQTLMLAGATGFLLQLAATTIKAFRAIGTEEEVV